jgi:predicted DNA-binding ribbon-helix-helix protein
MMPTHEAGTIMKSLVVKRSIFLASHKTSVSLEDEFWTALKEIAGDRHVTLSELTEASTRSANPAISHLRSDCSCWNTIAAKLQRSRRTSFAASSQLSVRAVRGKRSSDCGGRCREPKEKPRRSGANHTQVEL